MADQLLVNNNHSKTSATRNVAVSVDHISKTYPVSFLRLKKALKRKFKPPVEAVRDVSFEVGEVLRNLPQQVRCHHGPGDGGAVGEQRNHLVQVLDLQPVVERMPESMRPVGE